MTDAERDTALALLRHLRSQGAGDHTNVGVGSKDIGGNRVPALHVYITPQDNCKCHRMVEYDGMPVLWHISGKARPLSAA
jgi:hypothetical protein